MSGSEHSFSTDGLRIVERYEVFVSYVYEILQTAPRKHGVLRNLVLERLFEPVGGLYHAARSKQVSRLHAIDAQFATLRSHLRFMVKVKIISVRQHGTALTLLAESGAMLGAWIKKLGGQAGK
jgi:hypothetical protein